MLMKAKFRKLPIHKVSWDQLRFPPFLHQSLANGAQLYTMQSNNEGLCYFEFVFENGRIAEHKPLVSRVCANQILEGTQSIAAEEVVDKLDYYGAHCAVHADLDFTVLSMSCLQRHFKELSQFVLDLLTEPAFREGDLAKAKVFYLSQLQHQLAEPDYISYREFTSKIYGEHSVYGYNSSADLFQSIENEDLKKYHRENYLAGKLKVFYCGDLSEEHVGHFISQIGRLASGTPEHRPYTVVPAKAGRWHFPLKNCAQLSLKLGCRTFKRDDPDFYSMYVLNTILGDYFGSRLMKKIREDRGLTYDIHSTLDAQKHDGCFYISAELAPQQFEAALGLIMEEISILKSALIPESELSMVRNYLCGHIMRLLDGPFQSISFLKILATEYCGPKAFDDLLDQILHIRPAELREMARRYFPDDGWTIVTAGAGN